MPTRRQWLTIRNIIGNGWGDGDYLEYAFSAADKKHVKQSLLTFEAWLEKRYQIKFKHSLT